MLGSLVLGSLVLGALCLLAGGCKAPKPPQAPKGPKRPVVLRLARLGGGVIDLTALRGGPLIIAIFTTWSLRSQAEAPQINSLAARYHHRGLRVIGISIDRNAKQLVETYVEFVKFTFPVANADPEDLDLVAALGVTRSVPRTLLLDREGRILQDHRGGTDLRRLVAGIERVLGKPPPASPRSRPTAPLVSPTTQPR